MERAELDRSFPERRLIGDRITLIYGLRPMADHRHCGRPRNAGALQVPNCGAAEIMAQPSRNTGGAAGGQLGAAEVAHWLAVPVEQPWNDLTRCSLECTRLGKLRFEHGAQLGR